MKIYTKMGDDGQTSLFSGERIPKNHHRIDAIGTTDELNALIGLVRDVLEDESTKKFLIEIQKNIFSIGAQLANTGKKIQKTEIEDKDVQDLEQAIDAMELELPRMTHFILPGGHLKVSYIHLARAVCRRAERCCIPYLLEGDITFLKYLNRLSDYLFVLARYVAKNSNAEEVKWI